MEFDDFGVHLGVPLGDHFGIFGRKKLTFAAVPFLVRKLLLKREGSASEVGVMGDSFEVRKGSKMQSQHAMLPAFGGAAEFIILKTPYGVPPPHPFGVALVDPLEVALGDV